MTITAAKEAVISSGRKIAAAPASNDPAAIRTTPAPASSRDSHVLPSIRSRRKSQPSSAAIIGAAACMNRTFATVV